MSIIIDIMTNVKIFVDKQYQYYYNINPSLLITTTVAIHDQYPLWIFKIHIHQYPWMSSTCSSKLSRNGACPTAFLLPAMSNTNKPFVGIGLAKLKLPMTITKGQLAFVIQCSTHHSWNTHPLDPSPSTLLPSFLSRKADLGQVFYVFDHSIIGTLGWFQGQLPETMVLTVLTSNLWGSCRLSLQRIHRIKAPLGHLHPLAVDNPKESTYLIIS
jgi:hypothetical protein